jgi:hypothetical protein
MEIPVQTEQFDYRSVKVPLINLIPAHPAGDARAAQILPRFVISPICKIWRPRHLEPAIIRQHPELPKLTCSAEIA